MMSRKTFDPAGVRTTIEENGLTYVFVMAAPRGSTRETDTGVFFESEGSRVFCRSGIARDLPRGTNKVLFFPKTPMVVIDDIFEEIGLNEKEPEPDLVGIWVPVVT